MVGAAAALAGVTRTTISLAVIVMELTGSLTYAVVSPFTNPCLFLFLDGSDKHPSRFQPILIAVLAAKTVRSTIFALVWTSRRN